MVVLTGKNLGERHRELNSKVAQVVANKEDFDKIKNEEDATDVGKLYKINIASQYKDADYIVEVLKSGDVLYITKALKCVWLYHDSYSNIVNIENLHRNIFPFMSIKMKKKMLTTLSMHIKNPERAASFYIYCKRNHMFNIAYKFLIYTSEDFKLNVLKNENILTLYPYIDYYELAYIKDFVGDSFVLAVTFIEMSVNLYRQRDIVHNLKHMYAINNKKYLDLVEKYEIIDLDNLNASHRFGARISRDIMTKYKYRVLKNTLLYVNKLKKCILAKYSSKSEAKKYLRNLMPKDVKLFWKIDFCTIYDYILNLIPINEKFEFMKQLFSATYPEQSFESTLNFYQLKYYNIMTIDQRELWAMRQIEEQNEVLGTGNDYMWYKFVNIDKVLTDIKKYIMITPDSHKRASMVNILVEAATNQDDLKKVLNYYYERHINENDKTVFIDKVLSVHNVFELDKECWEALNKLFYSLDLYCEGRYTDKVYVAVAVICHILHNLDMPKALLDFVDLDVNYSYFSLLVEKLSKEKAEKVFQYLLNLFIDKLKPFEQDPNNKKLRKKLERYVHNIHNLSFYFKKGDEDRPEIVKKFMAIHSPKPKEEKTITVKDIFHYIKTDATLALNALGQTDLDITAHRSEIVSRTLRKVKIYFHDDVAQEYVKCLDRMIHNSSDDYGSYKRIEGAVFGIFQLSDETFKVAFMEKYCPSEPKIDHSTIDRKLRCIQESICRYTGYSRPPVPLRNVLQYIKGDYVQYCLPMFNMYLVNLPFPQVMKFTESILNSPLSVQKHGLRLAFQCYSSESVKTLIMNTWKKTKNVSLRKIIYLSLFNKLTREESDEDFEMLYDALKFFTSDLHQDDDQDLFDSICSHRGLSKKFIDDYLQTGWHMVIRLPSRPVNIDRQIKVIKSIDDNIKLVERDFLRKTIIDGHVHEMLDDRRLDSDESDKLKELRRAKWNLTANYISQYTNNEELDDNLGLLSHIFGKCIEMWMVEDKFETLIYQKFYFDFLTYIEDKNFGSYNDPENPCSTPIYKHILDLLLGALPLKEMYLIVWNLKMNIYIRTSLTESSAELCEGDGKLKPLSREENVCDNIAKHIDNFIQELLQTNQFYPVYLSEIAWLIKCKLQNLYNMNNLDVILSQSLANIVLKESYLLALMILPTDAPEGMKEIHAGILKKIQTFENDEVQSYLHFKFLSTYKYMFSGGR